MSEKKGFCLFTGLHGKVQRRTSEEICKQLYLTECGLQPPPAPSSFAWGSVERHGPSMLGRQTVCVRDCRPASVKQNRLTYYTRSHFKPSLNQVVEGWIPLNSLWSYCVLWSIALNPHRSSCGYQTHRFYEDAPEHNRQEVTVGTFISNSHLFHNAVIKKRIRMSIFIFIFLACVDCRTDISIPDWMMTAPRLLFSLSFR